MGKTFLVTLRLCEICCLQYTTTRPLSSSAPEAAASNQFAGWRFDGHPEEHHNLGYHLFLYFRIGEGTETCETG